MRKLIAIGIAALGIVACFPQGQCESNPGFVDYCGPGDVNCQGQIIDANHWISGPISGQWLDFSREKTILMHFRDAKTGATLAGQVVWTDVAINVSSTLTAAPNQGVPCAGNDCEFDPLPDGSGVYVKNDSCTDYFVYVYVTLDTSAADAGTD